MGLVVLATWLPDLASPLGNSHEGRILGRLGLHLANFWEDGAGSSRLASDLRPYAPEYYAHHPPLVNAVQVGISGIFGQGESQLRVFGYFSGFASIISMAALMRALRIRWGALLIALGVMAATNFFWVYGRLGAGYWLIVALAALSVRLRNTEDPPTWLMAATVVAGFATAMLSWPGVIAAALLGLWLLKGRGFDRPTVYVGLAMVLGVILDFAWILYATEPTELAEHTANRTTGLGFTIGEFFVRQWRWLTELLPSWYLVLAIPALGFALLDRRTRFPAGLLLAITVGWTFGIPDGAYVHDFWNLMLLAPVSLGVAVLFDRLFERTSTGIRLVLGLAIAALLLAGFAGIVRGPVGQVYFDDPQVAGELLEETRPAPDQQVIWVTDGIPTPRWASWYWGLPPRTLTAEELAAQPDSRDLVLVRLDRLPDWIPATVEQSAVVVEGSYALVRFSELAALTGA
jgi:hypothetical protein